MFDMSDFPTVYGYANFERSVKCVARFVHDSETRDFLKIVMETSEIRRKTVQRGKILYRAQRGFTFRTIDEDGEEFEIEEAHSADRMVPNPVLIGEGRANSRGIPCLYLATNAKTAMSEVRPWVGSYISLAQFKVMRDCEVVDCSMDKERSNFCFTASGDLKEPDAAGRESGVWGDIAQAFSRPVTIDEPRSDYVPTQILAEAFRNHGYNGIVYKSLLDDGGFNIALFDVASAELINCCLYQTKTVSFEFDQTGNTYFIPKHYAEIAVHATEPEKSVSPPTEL